jgi:hypothetical protein
MCCKARTCISSWRRGRRKPATWSQCAPTPPRRAAWPRATARQTTPTRSRMMRQGGCWELESSDQRPILAGIAAETVQILERGFYTSAAGTRVELAAWIERCVAGSAYFEPEALAEIEAAVLGAPNARRTHVDCRRRGEHPGRRACAGAARRVSAGGRAQLSHRAGGRAAAS